MQTIIESSPLSRAATIELPNGVQISLVAGQAIVWPSITPREVLLLPTNWPRFPAVIDTGFSGGFLIGQRELRAWAGVDLSDLLMAPQGTSWRRICGQVVPAYQATLWMHRNVPQQHEPATSKEASAIYPGGGILVTHSDRPLARMPLLGPQLLESWSHAACKYRWTHYRSIPSRSVLSCGSRSDHCWMMIRSRMTWRDFNSALSHSLVTCDIAQPAAVIQNEVAPQQLLIETKS